MERLPEGVLAEILTWLRFGGTKRDRKNVMLVEKKWLRLARKCFYLPYTTLAFSCISGNVDLLKELLKDPRVDPSDLDHCALLFACKYGRTELIKELVQHPK